MERVYVSIHAARDVKIVWYDEKTGVLDNIVLDADKGLHEPLKAFMKEFLFKRTRSIYIDYLTDRDLKADRKVKVMNRLPGQRKYRRVSVNRMDQSIPGAWETSLPFSKLRFNQVRNFMKDRMQSYWLISRATWQRWHGLNEILVPDMTANEVSLVHRVMATARWPRFKARYQSLDFTTFAPALLLLAFGMDRKECFYDYRTFKPRRYF